MVINNAEEVGISVFLDSDTPGFYGKVKSIFQLDSSPADFIVREISLSGQVVQFTSDYEYEPSKQVSINPNAKDVKRKKERILFDEPSEGWSNALEGLIGEHGQMQLQDLFDETCQESTCYFLAPNVFRDRLFLQECIQQCYPGCDCRVECTAENEVRQIKVTVDPLYKRLRSRNVSVENCKRILHYLRKGVHDPFASEGIVLSHEDTKAERTMLHRNIAQICSALKSRTDQVEGRQCVTVYFSDKALKKRKRDQGVYLRFTLQKINQEHFSTIDRLSRFFKCKPSCFSYAGMKDKCAVTYQHVVVEGLPPSQLLSINKSDDISGIKVGDVEFVNSSMNLGDSKGNRFDIILRDIRNTVKDDTVDKAIQHVLEKGFINYFGFQRVGVPSSAVRPHHIGEYIVRKEWQKVIAAVFAIDSSDTEILQRAKRAFLEQNNIDEAIKLVPRSQVVERAILQALKRFGNSSYESAVMAIPFGRRLMYMNAFQSYLFNCFASWRIKEFGCKLVEGDLIRSKYTGSVVSIDKSMLNTLHSDGVAELLLPLPGQNTIMPSYMPDELVQKAVGCGQFLKGTYRNVVVVPDELSWEYQADESLVKVSFSLPSGSFATMCIREILKVNV